MNDDVDDEVVFDGQTAKPVLENGRRHFLSISHGTAWGFPSINHTLHQLGILSPSSPVPSIHHPSEISFGRHQRPPPQQRDHSDQADSKRIQFLESVRCPLAIYAMEYELACCRLVYLLVCANTLKGDNKQTREEFKRRIPICRSIRHRRQPAKQQQDPNGSDEASSTRHEVACKIAPFMEAVERFAKLPSSTQRLLDLWDMSKLESDDPVLQRESVAAFDPYLTRSLIWCLRPNKYHSRMKKKAQQKAMGGLKARMESDRTTAQKKVLEQQDKNELNADVLNAWMKLLQRRHDQKTNGKPKVLFLTTDYMTTLCSPEGQRHTPTSSTTLASRFSETIPSGSRRVVSEMNKRASGDITPEKRDCAKRRKLNVLEENHVKDEDLEASTVKGDRNSNFTMNVISSPQETDHVNCEECNEKASDEGGEDQGFPVATSMRNPLLDGDNEHNRDLRTLGFSAGRMTDGEGESRDRAIDGEEVHKNVTRSTRHIDPLDPSAPCSLSNIKISDTTLPAVDNKLDAPSMRTSHGDSVPSQIRFLDVSSVARVSKYFQKRNLSIWDFDRVCLPVHVLAVHWALLVIDVKNKELQFYDPMRSACVDVVNDRLKDTRRDQSFLPVLNPLGFPLHIIPCNQTEPPPDSSLQQQPLPPDSQVQAEQPANRFSRLLSKYPKLRSASGWMLFEYVDRLLEYEAQRLIKIEGERNDLKLPWNRIVVEGWPQQNPDRHDCGVVVAHYARCLSPQHICHDDKYCEPDFTTGNIEVLRLFTALCIQSGFLEVDDEPIESYDLGHLYYSS